MLRVAYRRKSESLNSDQIGTLMPRAQCWEQLGVAGCNSPWKMRLSHGDLAPQTKVGNDRVLASKDPKNTKIAKTLVTEVALSITADNWSTRAVEYWPPMTRHRFGILIFHIKVLNRKREVHMWVSDPYMKNRQNCLCGRSDFSKTE